MLCSLMVEEVEGVQLDPDECVNALVIHFSLSSAHTIRCRLFLVEAIFFKAVESLRRRPRPIWGYTSIQDPPDRPY